MKVIVGLGNPGKPYEATRHNAGFMAVDRFLHRHARDAAPRARFHSDAFEAGVRGQKVCVLKPATYMNRSGIAVAEAVSFYKVDPATDLLVFVDDLALPLGAIRVRAEGSAGGHNGLADIQRALGTLQYPRLRIGIDPKPPFMIQADYVLSKFTSEDLAAVAACLERAADAAECFIEHGVAAAMNRFNAPTASTPPPHTPPPPVPHAGTSHDP